MIGKNTESVVQKLRQLIFSLNLILWSKQPMIILQSGYYSKLYGLNSNAAHPIFIVLCQ